MTAAELERAGRTLFGKRWKTHMARALSLDITTIWRYASGQLEIPGPVAAAVRCWLENGAPEP